MPYGSFPIIDIPGNLPHICDVERMETAPDMYGGDVPVPVAVTTNLRCFVQTASQKEVDQFQKRGFDVSHKVYFPASVELREDSILVNLRATAQFPPSLRLKVRSIADATTNLSPDISKAMCLAEFGDEPHDS